MPLIDRSSMNALIRPVAKGVTIGRFLRDRFALHFRKEKQFYEAVWRPIFRGVLTVNRQGTRPVNAVWFEGHSLGQGLKLLTYKS